MTRRLPLLAAVLLTTCSLAQNQPQTDPTTPQPTAPQSVTLRATADGTVKEIHIKPDDAVKADQPLVTITPSGAAPTNEAEKKFAETLTNATLIGQFTDAARPDAPPREERYTISSVRKIMGDRWLINARIQYGGKDVTVPMLLPVKFADDTPMISLTDLNIPGLGTYTARVLFYRDQYAGTWSGGKHGGHLWGRIERPAPEK